MKTRMRLVTGLCLLVACALVALVGSSSASAASANDAFYKYTGSKALSSHAPGAVLKTRTIPYHILGFPTPLKATQLLYRATDAQNRPAVNVTTVIQPSCLLCLNRNNVISYQSFYDSLNPDDQPSVQIAGGLSLGGMIAQMETALFVPFLMQGYSIVTSDTQGQKADFAAGPEYGTNTLDSIRAAINSKDTKINKNAKVALIGYSGGAIATEWAAELAPTYAPDLNKNLIGAAFGGVLVHPANNLPYVEGSLIWAGVAPMAMIGIARSYDIDMSPYVNERGAALLKKLDKASITNVLGQYPGLTWAEMVKPQYARPNSIPEFVTAANKVIMGRGATPKMPMLIGQGTGGELEGTPGNKAGIGKGDGVMIAGDVRTLVRDYCAKGAKIQYTEYAGSHILAALQWLPGAIKWVNDRFSIFSSLTLPNNCKKVKVGNSLAPLVYQP